MKLWICVLLAAPAFAGPLKAPQRVVLHTVAGDMVVALYPQVAPRTVAQFLRLVRHGVYDTGHFRRLEPGFVIQLGGADDRVVPLSAVQRAIVEKIPAEFSATLKHRRGVLSMARYDNDINSAQTSFSILLAEAPHLDGKYTIFGELESGADVLHMLERVPINPDKTPKLRLTLNYVDVAETPKALASLALAKAAPLTEGVQNIERQIAEERAMGGAALAWVLVVLVVISAAGALFGKKLRTIMLLQALVGGFALFCYLVPLSAGSPWLASALFIGSAALFRSLSYFELPNKS